MCLTCADIYFPNVPEARRYEDKSCLWYKAMSFYPPYQEYQRIERLFSPGSARMALPLLSVEECHSFELPYYSPVVYVPYEYRAHLEHYLSTLRWNSMPFHSVLPQETVRSDGVSTTSADSSQENGDDDDDDESTTTENLSVQDQAGQSSSPVVDVADAEAALATLKLSEEDGKDENESAEKECRCMCGCVLGKEGTKSG